MPQEENATVEIEHRERTLLVRPAGEWTVRQKVPHWAGVVSKIKEREGPLATSLRFDVDAVSRFDSILVTFLLQVCDAAEAAGLAVERDSLPDELARLVKLARAVPAKTDAHRHKTEGPWIEQLGSVTIELYEDFKEVLAFVGEVVLSLGRFVRGRAKLRWKEFGVVLEDVSVRAVPIVSLISFLVGVIISFLGAVTLKQFGAEFAVSYLVGYGMLREMGAVMTGIIMAGRTGAAFAAQIGSMKVNEEIDALRTFGISPIDFLVLPRLAAMLIMLPILTFYANVIGILSGWLVAEFVMGVPGTVFFAEMTRVVDMPDFLLGIFKAGVFGGLIGFAGCLRGLQSESGADSVGRAATRAVVTAITLIIFFNALIDWGAALLDV
jgi:phospholipid/cholesterol/gamma-HCH transport system permease protein